MRSPRTIEAGKRERSRNAVMMMAVAMRNWNERSQRWKMTLIDARRVSDDVPIRRSPKYTLAASVFSSPFACHDSFATHTSSTMIAYRFSTSHYREQTVVGFLVYSAFIHFTSSSSSSSSADSHTLIFHCNHIASAVTPIEIYTSFQQQSIYIQSYHLHLYSKSTAWQQKSRNDESVYLFIINTYFSFCQSFFLPFRSVD